MKQMVLLSAIILCALSSQAQSSDPILATPNEGNSLPVVASHPTSDFMRLHQQPWKLVELNGNLVATPTDRQRQAFIHFHEASNRVTGMGGCNRFSGQYHIDLNEQLTVGSVVATRMFCGDNNPEAAFFQALTNLRRYDFAGEQLMFFDEAGNRIAVFEAMLTKP